MESVIYRVKMPLEKYDENFIQIQDLIEAKRNFLLAKQKKLRFISKQNRFLDEVRKDYSKYYGYVAEQKQNQIKALQLLENYIEDLTKSGNLTKHNIEDAKEEQKKILREIKQIKNTLDSIVDDTDYVNSTLIQKTINNAN
jgi:hypothetical protein